jgi:hypothetical protein
MTTERPIIKSLNPTKNSLTFSDGLNFGCGFWVAGFLFTVVAIPTAALILSLLIGFLGGLAGLGR